MDYQKEQNVLDKEIFSQMKICSLNLQCSGLSIDFVPKEGHEPYTLHKERDELNAFFTIPQSQKNYLKIYMKRQEYNVKLHKIQDNLLIKFFIVLVVLAFFSALFAFYTLSPLRNALHLTEEFIKDILHDFNTPLSTLRLNVSLLKNDCKKSKKLLRIENAVQNILNLQSNLRAYLHAHATQKTLFDLREILQERIESIHSLYRDITFELHVDSLQIETNRDAFIRIIDNLLSNAAKYNKKEGYVILSLEKNRLLIQDTGKGIKEPKRVFERFYKEQERGIGIGLHIVKKLSDELGIEIALESEIGKGSCFSLNLQKLIKR